MNWRHYLILFIVGLSVPLMVSLYQSEPGSLDADYYFAGGIQLATGKGFTEPYLWNYIDGSTNLPHPSHTYWMPLASIISALGMWITGQTTYAAGRLPFILLSACVPLLTATLAFDISRDRLIAMTAGLLSVFSFFYAPYMPVPDNYAIFMLLGGTFLLILPRKQRWIPFALGAIAGLMTLARTDGLLWLGLAGISVMLKSAINEAGRKNSFREWFGLIIPAGLFTLLGYLMVMGAWHYRTWALFDSFLTPGGGRLLWLGSYNEIFTYPIEKITRAGFIQLGWNRIVQDRVSAFWSNLNYAFLGQSEIFLTPFILIGLYRWRSELRTKISTVGWLLLFFVLTIAFPYAGSRGSFSHAGAAFQPYWWAMASIGVGESLLWANRRNYFMDKAAPYIFQGILVSLAMLTTFYLVNYRVVANNWIKEDVNYSSVEKMLVDNRISPKDVVIVRDPPRYFIQSGRSAIILPYGDESSILQVAKQFKAGYLVLEKKTLFESMRSLYEHPLGNPSFAYLGEVDGARIYRIELTH